MPRLFILLFSWMLSVSLWAQLPDSVMLSLDALFPEEKAQSLKEYAFKMYPYDKEVALQASAAGIDIAKEHKLWEKIADGLNTRGAIYGAYREMDSSFACYARALKLCDQYGFDQIKMKVGMNTGINHFYQGDYEKAIQSYHTSLRILEEKNDSVGIAHASANIGLSHIRREDHARAIEYLKRALVIYQLKGMVPSSARTLNGLGSAYLEVNLDSSIHYLEEGRKLLGEDDRSTIKGLMNINLGNAYSYKEEYEKSIVFYNQAYTIASSAEDVAGLITALMNMGRVNNDRGNYSVALRYFLEAMPLVEESGELHKELQLTTMMVKSYEEIGNYQLALEYQHRQIALHDSIYSLESNEHIQELEAKYEFEKKEKEIALKEMKLAQSTAQNQRKTIAIIVLTSGFLLISLLGWMIFKNYRQQQKKKEALAQQKMREYARQIELLRTSIDMQLNKTEARIPIDITQDDLNEYLIDPLTEREMEVLQKVAAGKTNKQVAEEIFISVSTVKYHLSNVYLKLDVHNRTEALAKASAMRLISS